MSVASPGFDLFLVRKYMDSQLTSRQVASLIGIKHASWQSYYHKGRAPKPDGYFGDNAAWWYYSTIEKWMHARKRRKTL